MRVLYENSAFRKKYINIMLVLKICQNQCVWEWVAMTVVVNDGL